MIFKGKREVYLGGYVGGWWFCEKKAWKKTLLCTWISRICRNLNLSSFFFLRILMEPLNESKKINPIKRSVVCNAMDFMLNINSDKLYIFPSLSHTRSLLSATMFKAQIWISKFLNCPHLKIVLYVVEKGEKVLFNICFSSLSCRLFRMNRSLILMR